MNLFLTEADTANVRALNMDRISVAIDGIELAKLIDKLNDIIARHYPEELAARGIPRPMSSQPHQHKPHGNGTLNGIPEKTKRPMLINNIGLNIGGTDGTRTRDPLRDRQVF
ncbi:MAG: hypothetical protein H6R25_3164 [Proteobacteria bacterium]|nr:hypothetical protein [Pseudomonadota bacterium]